MDESAVHGYYPMLGHHADGEDGSNRSSFGSSALEMMNRKATKFGIILTASAGLTLVILLVVGTVLFFRDLQAARQAGTAAQDVAAVGTVTAIPQVIARTRVPAIGAITGTVAGAATGAATETATATSTVLPQPTFTEPAVTTAAASSLVTSSPTPEPSPTISPTPTVSGPTHINGVRLDELAVMPDEVRAHVREIFILGQTLGRSPRAFSKLGDSLIATPNFLTPFDTGNYNLAAFDYLQPVIDYYAGSFVRYGVAVRPGLHSWSIFDPLWANKDWCLANEDVLACEIRLNNPSVMLILMGSNDSGAADSFNYHLRKTVEYCLEKGIIPVIATKADRFEGDDNRNNIILRQIAVDYQIPLWDFDAVAGTLLDRGLVEDRVHLSVFPSNDYSTPEAFQFGHPVHNLTGLLILERIWQEITAVEMNLPQE
jgi:hypothetical protein